MTNYHYLIIGGGMTAAAAVNGIREVDAAGTIGLFSTEADAPYNRPPLSKALWKGTSLDTVWRKLEGASVELHLGCTIREILPQRKRVVDDRGNFFSYQKLLLATGATPRRLPIFDDRLIHFRTLSDYRRLRILTETGKRFAVIGGGFIGSEVAAALVMNGKEVVMVFPGKAIGERIFPPTLAEHISSVYRQKGVELLVGEKVLSCDQRRDQRVLKTSGGRTVIVDAVVAGIGIEPNVDLARAIGLKVEDGITVDEFLRTSGTDIFAAGDVASFLNPVLKTRMRVEHEDNANTMGRLAGRNMAGKSERYTHLPSFYSDLFEMGYEAVGELDSRLEMIEDWKERFKEGVIYYLRDGRVRGVLLWNVWDRVEAARKLIAEPRLFTAEALKGRLN